MNVFAKLYGVTFKDLVFLMPTYAVALLNYHGFAVPKIILEYIFTSVTTNLPSTAFIGYGRIPVSPLRKTKRMK